MTIITFISLGQMGSPIASNLLQQGRQFRIFDANAEAARHLAGKDMTPVANPVQTAKDTEFIITMLPDDDLVHSMLFGGSGVYEDSSTDALVIDMSTIHSLQTDKLIADMRARGFNMMDVPIDRISVNAITDTLLLLTGGITEQVKRATPILMAMGSESINSDGPSMGTRVELINSYMSIALNALSTETTVLCEALNLPFDVVIRVINGTTADKGHFITPWPSKILSRDLFPVFMVNLARKDLGIALDVANQLRMPVLLRAVSQEVYSQTYAAGYGRQGRSAILEQVRVSARVTVKVKMQRLDKGINE